MNESIPDTSLARQPKENLRALAHDDPSGLRQPAQKLESQATESGSQHNDTLGSSDREPFNKVVTSRRVRRPLASYIKHLVVAKIRLSRSRWIPRILVD